MRLFAAVAFAAAVVSSAAFAADPVGRYAVSGVSPGGGGSYSGTATVTKTGDTFKVV
jgi:hypothetical protein